MTDRILIVGGGIGGLTLAVLLNRRGTKVEIVERAPAFHAVGAGIVLSANAMAVLERAGIADRIHAEGRIARSATLTDERGRLIKRIEDMTSERYGPSVAIHRTRLHEILASSLGDSQLHMAETVASLEPAGDGVDVTLSGGARGRYSLVVGADGIRSSVREHVAPDAGLRYSGYTSWRMVVEGAPGHLEPVEMWGRGKRFGVVTIGEGTWYAYATANAPAGGEDPKSGRIEGFKRAFAEFASPASDLLALLDDPEALIRTDIDEVSAPTWSRGRVVLLGDAAHAMTPNLGQGAAMAIEDAYVLDRVLAETAPLESALAEYERLRRPRVEAIADEARRIGRMGQWSAPAICALRRVLLKLVPDSVSQARMERLLFENAPALDATR